MWSLGFSSPLGVLSIPTSIRSSTISGEIKNRSILINYTDNLVKEYEIENNSEFIFRLNVYHNNQFTNKFSIPSFPLIR